MNRREFSKLMALSAAGTLLSACGFGGTVEEPEQILVIGAGMAGIAAARTLLDAGHQVTVLEARDRIGGRMWTSRKWPNSPVDLGASWIHGVRGNPLTALADEIDAPRMATDYDNAELYGVNGGQLSGRYWTQYQQYTNQIRRAIQAAGRSESDMSILQAIEAEIDLDTLSVADRQIFNLTTNQTFEHEWAADIDKLSAHFIDEGKAFGGGDVIFPEGYDSILNHLAGGLDIRLNEKVSSVGTTDNGVKIESTSGGFEADRVVVTLPIGVLKTDAVAFDPPLPSAKTAAIQALGSGILNKVYLQFPSAFWQRRPEWLAYISEPKGRYSSWFNIYHYTSDPILMAFNGGQFGAEVESFTDDQIVDQAMSTLTLMYGSSVVDPLDAQITRWLSDPLALGSYSYPAVGMTDTSRDDLASPVGNRLFFAGEATNADYPSTVHGAYLSGVREAERILDLTS